MTKSKVSSRDYPDPRSPRQRVVVAAGNLRHLYKQLIRSFPWTAEGLAEAARGLLGPAIAKLELVAQDLDEHSEVPATRAKVAPKKARAKVAPKKVRAKVAPNKPVPR